MGRDLPTFESNFCKAIMRIHLYTILFNEERMLPYFFRHYDQYVEKYVIADDGSTDGTLAILSAHPRVEIRPSPVNRQDVCGSGATWKSNAWKESKGEADLVIVCDVDELVYHEDLAGFLEEKTRQGFNILEPIGYQMRSDSFPATQGQIYDEVVHGWTDTMYNKPCVINPNVIDEVNYTNGCHEVRRPRPHHKVKLLRGDPAFKLLHFKYLGLDYVRSRYTELRAKLGETDLEKGAAPQYSFADAQLRGIFERGFQRVL